MNTLKFSKPHMVLLAAILVLATLAGIVSKVSTNTIERTVASSASDLLGIRLTEYRWEFLRDGMVLGRILSGDEAIYLFNVRLFGGDHRYAITIQNDGRPKVFASLGTGPVSPHSARINTVMQAYTGRSLENRTALDEIITHSILASIQTIAIHERSRKEVNLGD